MMKKQVLSSAGAASEEKQGRPVLTRVRGGSHQATGWTERANRHD